MTSRASIYYDCNQLFDVLLLQDVRTISGQHEGDVAIKLDSDQLIDDIIKSLTKLKRDGQILKLERDVTRLTQERKVAIEIVKNLSSDWSEANEAEHRIHSELHKAETALRNVKDGIA